MARGDFPFDRHGLNVRFIVAGPHVRSEVGVPLNDLRPGGPTCTLGVSFPPLEDAVVLADFAGVALGVPRTFSARVRGVCDDDGGLIASRCVDIPLVGTEGEVSGILCHTGPRCDTRGAAAPRGQESVRAIADVAQFIVHDINNLFAVIGSGLRLLECQSDAAYRKAIVGKMQEAIKRGALVSRQLLDAARPCPESSSGSVAPLPSARARR
jgi:hypothetical protein